ncbi:MAG: hypothetical protein M0R80_03660 [Proteobacteria bacterium]|jgi:hypothetical protein|nr:hypothetical protein [Pseudomonadota bacterium]
MKERVGFVSNSSSCSFICNLCGKMEEGWDWDEIPSMGDLLRCEKGHLLCREHFSFKKTKPDPQRVASKFCPLCRASANSLKEYLLKKSGKTVDEIIEEICNNEG